MWDSPYEMVTPLPSSPLIYVVKRGGAEEGKSVCSGTGELARCWEDHKDFGGMVAVMWLPADTHGH